MNLNEHIWYQIPNSYYALNPPPHPIQIKICSMVQFTKPHNWIYCLCIINTHQTDKLATSYQSVYAYIWHWDSE